MGHSEVDADLQCILGFHSQSNFAVYYRFSESKY